MRLNYLKDFLKIYEFFKNNKDVGLSISELSKNLKIPYRRTRDILFSLYELGYVDFFHHKNKKIYYYLGTYKEVIVREKD